MTTEEVHADDVARVLRSLRRLLMVVVVIGALLITANRLMAHRACESSRKDRIDNAAGWTSHREYIQKVTGAASVKEDVKSAAREANLTYTRVSARLTNRADVNCSRIIP